LAFASTVSLENHITILVFVVWSSFNIFIELVMGLGVMDLWDNEQLIVGECVVVQHQLLHLCR